MALDYCFDEQVALITGGGRGLGQVFAEALAQAGATVVLVARSEVQLQDAAQAIEKAGGHVLAFAAGLQALPAASAYCISKTAVIRLTESLALETRDQGIRVFAMHPGTVRTPMNDYAAESDDVKQRAPFVQQWFQQLYRDGRDTPIKRSVDLMLGLASGKADALSGRYLDVDDDLDALLQQTEAIERDDMYTLRLRT